MPTSSAEARGSTRKTPTALLLLLVGFAAPAPARAQFRAYFGAQPHPPPPPPPKHAEPPNYYETLGVDDAATEREIKQAYRRLSMLHHPDKGGDPQVFTRISAAYETLGDSEKRALYDVGGVSAVADAGKTDMFGRPVGVPRGPSVEIAIAVPLADMYTGAEVRARVRRRVVCRGCKNRAADGLARCAGCTLSCPNEVRIVQRRMGPMLMKEEVQVPSEELCKDEARELSATIERGAGDQTRITFERASEQSPGMLPGDVVILLRAEKHSAFGRQGNDLLLELKVSLKEALLGFRREVRHLDGHAVMIEKSGVSRPGELIVIAGEGMPLHGVPSEFGDLRVTLVVVFPEQLSASESSFVRDAFVPLRRIV